MTTTRTLPPAMGTNNVLMIGTEAPYTALTASNGSVEVVLTAWRLQRRHAGGKRDDVVNGVQQHHHLPSGLYAPIRWTTPTTAPAKTTCSGYDQPNDGVAELAGIGDYFHQSGHGLDQCRSDGSADDMVLSWAEAGGSYGFDSAQLSWSSDGVSFSTNAAWPSWDPTDGSTYVTRYAEFDGVVTPGLSKVYIRINLGPGYGGVSGYYRMDNVQPSGLSAGVPGDRRPDRGLRQQAPVRANLYDTNSGLDKAQAVMKPRAPRAPGCRAATPATAQPKRTRCGGNCR